jgi:hypothetical protein
MHAGAAGASAHGGGGQRNAPAGAVGGENVGAMLGSGQ